MSERGQHWQAIAISIGLHLLPLLLLVHCGRAAIADAAGEGRAHQPAPAGTGNAASATGRTPGRHPSQAQQARASRPTKSPSTETHRRTRGRGSRQRTRWRWPASPAGRPACGRDRCKSRTGIGHGRAAAPDAPPADFRAGAASDQWGSPPDGAAGALSLLPCCGPRTAPAGHCLGQGQHQSRGRLLALRLEQSSGQPMLDGAALQTFRRAQPLPPIPDELKAPQELVVPVEYYLR